MKNKKIAIMVMMMTLAAVGSMGCGKSAGAGQTVSAEKEKEESWIDKEWDEDDSEDWHSNSKDKDKDKDKKEEDTEQIDMELATEENDSEYVASYGSSHGSSYGTHDTVNLGADTDDHTTDAVQSSGSAGLISDDWTDMEFMFDGAYYALPASYQELEANGWSFDLAEYGYSDGYVLNPGDKTYDTIELTNPAYDEDLMVWVGFINTSDTAKDILDCDIWSIQLDTCSGFTQVDDYPYMEIADGIGIGSTREEVEAAFGPCDDIYEADEYGYVTYNYNVDYTYYLKITVFDDMGVTAISMSTYE